MTATPRKATRIAVSVRWDSRVLRRSREKPYVQNVAVAYSVVRSVVLDGNQRLPCVMILWISAYPVSGTAAYQQIAGL